MKIFSFKRLVGAAALAGIAYYVKQNGGPRAVFGSLQAKVKGLSAKAKDMMGGESTGSDRVAPKFGSSDVDRNVDRGNAASTYQSYRVSGEDENLH